jgi:hypothetical protein
LPVRLLIRTPCLPPGESAAQDETAQAGASAEEHTASRSDPQEIAPFITNGEIFGIQITPMALLNGYESSRRRHGVMQQSFGPAFLVSTGPEDALAQTSADTALLLGTL